MPQTDWKQGLCASFVGTTLHIENEATGVIGIPALHYWRPVFANNNEATDFISIHAFYCERTVNK